MKFLSFIAFFLLTNCLDAIQILNENAKNISKTHGLSARKKTRVPSKAMGKKGKGGKGAQDEAANAFLTFESSSDIKVIGCNSTSITIEGNISIVDTGTFLIYLREDDICGLCSPLFRKITRSTIDSPNQKVLTTAFATMGELFDQSIFNESLKNVQLEPLLGCNHSTKRNEGRYAKETYERALPTKAESFSFETNPACPSSWFDINPDGRCTHTDCFVGISGNPVDCFVCKNDCDNGCGSSFLKFDGNLFLFDFGPACCNHDHCYSSTSFTKAQCDTRFLKEMFSNCNRFTSIVSRLLPLPLKVFLNCPLMALTFYGLVAWFGNGPYDDAQKSQKDYAETESVCIAKCPSTQQSGGQGKTTLSIDLLLKKGTFPVSYEMYDIPDQLYIDFEGKRIFDTKGLVSGSKAVDVTFSGSTSIIQVVINAPNPGTKWDVSIGCPRSN